MQLKCAPEHRPGYGLKHGLKYGLMLTGFGVLAACSAVRWDEPPPPVVTEQRSDRGAAQLPGGDMRRTRRGNPPFYEVFGVRYQVMNSSEGYRERGIASWYGKKFHGRDTSSGERYDMYQMTAAHKTLPLPTNVRVTNLKNGRAIIVRVNDRGPFVKGRIIDLSYAAAQELDIVTSGTALVEVEALSTSYTGPVSTLAAATPPTESAMEPPPRMYVQVGAFGEAANAQNLASQLRAGGVPSVAVYKAENEMPQLFRVRIGPFSDIDEYDRIVAQVRTLQPSEPRLVVE